MKATRYVKTFAILTLIFVYLVIAAGSIVRATGSGMGCPDWPKCFGQWIPPTDVSELPADYEETFLEKRKTKLNTYLGLLEAIGLEDVATEMRADQRLLQAEPFSALGTWIEYLNRVVGFMSGNFLLLLFIASLWLIKTDPYTILLAFIGLISITFQAWLGSVVVATNLVPWVITVHMIVAFLIIALLISIYNRRKGAAVKWKECRPLIVLAIVLTLIQVVLGTQVRQQIDHLADQFINRSEWIANLSETFELHRSFSILMLLVNGFLIHRFWNSGRSWRMLGAILCTEILVGVVLAYLAMPRIAQPLHLLVATAFFGLQWHLLTERKKRLV